MISDLLTLIVIFLMFLIPIMIIFKNYKFTQKKALIVSVLLSFMPSIYYYFSIKGNSADPEKYFLADIKKLSLNFSKDFHFQSYKRGKDLYRLNFLDVEDVNLGYLNKIFITGFNYLDLSQQIDFIRTYNGILIKSPEACHEFAKNNLFINSKLIKNYQKLEKSDLDLFKWIVATSTLHFFNLAEKSSSKSEEGAFKEFEESLELNLQKISSIKRPWPLNRKSNDIQVSTYSEINTKCLKNMIEFESIDEASLKEQNRIIVQKIAESWFSSLN